MRLTTLATIVSFLSVSPFVAALRAMHQSNQTMGVKLRALAPGRVTYHGGPVISNVAVVTIFWGGAGKFSNADQINDMYRTSGITGSAYMDWLNEYNAGTQIIGRGQLLSTFSYDAAPTSTVTLLKLARLLKNLINTGRVPPPTANTYYAIHFAPGYYSAGQCDNYCAVTAVCKRSIDPTHIRYGIVATPDSSCSSCLLDTDGAFDSLSYWASYNLLQVVTDPERGFAGPTAPKEAWYDNSNGATITDICLSEGTQASDYIGQVDGGDGVTYTVAKGYSNVESACITSSATPVP